MLTPTLIMLFFLLLIVAAVVGVAYFTAQHLKESRNALRKRQEWWAAVGAYMGLQVASYPSSELGMLEGVSKGYWTRIIRTHRADLGQDVTRVITYHNPPLGLGLRMGRNSEQGVLNQMFGDGGIQTGDSSFDARFRVEGDDPEVILQILNADLRDQMVRYDHYIGALDLNDTQIGLDLVGNLPSVEQITNVLDAQRAVVTRLSKATTEVRSSVGIDAEASAHHNVY